MHTKKILISIAVLVALFCLVEASEENPGDMAEAVRLLQEWERMYSQASRPRVYRRDAEDGSGRGVDPAELDRAVKLLQLQELDRYYSDKTRPRFGKRATGYTNWEKDLEKPDIPAWLAYYARRR